jgi:hypothetical protein
VTPREAPGARRARRLAGRALAAAAGLVATGVAIRLLAAASVPLFFDEARVGVMVRGVLAGDFPFFFTGQAFMGAAEAYVHAPALGLLGSSALAVRAAAIAASLLYAAVAWRLAGRMFGDGRAAAALALLPSAYLLKWSIDPRLHYGLVLVLVPLCILLTLRAADATATAAARTRALLVLALVAGLGWWINLLMTAVLVPCAAWLLLRRRRLRRAALLVPAAFLLGSAPVWLFCLVHGRLPAFAVSLAWSAAPGQAWELVRRGLPQAMGVPPRVVEGPAGGWLAAGVGLALAGCLAVCLAGRTARRRGGVLLAGTVALTALAVVVSERGVTLRTEDPRYLLPAVALLPVLGGGAVAWLSRRGPAWLGPAALVAVLAVQTAGLVAVYPQLRSPARWQARRAATEAPARLAAMLAARGLTALYTHDPDVLAFLGGGRVAVSHFYLEDDPRAARRVDASPHVAYLAAQVPPGFDESLRAAGVRFSRVALGARALYTGFALEHAAYREIPRAGWRATAAPRPEFAPWVLDGDAGTLWRTLGRPEGAWLEVDLGREHPVGMVAWLPGGYREVPLGFRLETSVDGRRWTLAREVPEYYGPLYWAGGHPMGRVRWGRVEVRFPARPARHVRVTHLGADARIPWTIAELFVYETAPRGAAPPATDPVAAARALAARGVRRVYADHGDGARLAEAAPARLRTVPDNVRVDRYGLTPDLDRLPALELRPGAAVVYPVGAASGPAIEAALHGAGVGFVAEEVGGYRALSDLEAVAASGRTVPPTGATVAAVPAEGASAAVDGRDDTRWSTGRPQRAGDRLEVRLPAPVDLAGVELELGARPLEYPRGLALEVAREGDGWEPVPVTPAWLGPLVWTGTHVLAVGMERVRLTCAPVRARALRIRQTGEDPMFAWSVAELRLIVR